MMIRWLEIHEDDSLAKGGKRNDKEITNRDTKRVVSEDEEDEGDMAGVQGNRRKGKRKRRSKATSYDA
jgi:hypothetical protein